MTVFKTVVVVLQLPFTTVGGSNDQADPHWTVLFVAQLSNGTGFVTATVWMQ